MRLPYTHSISPADWTTQNVDPLQIIREVFGLNDNTRFHSVKRIRELLLGCASSTAEEMLQCHPELTIAHAALDYDDEASGSDTDSSPSQIVQ